MVSAGNYEVVAQSVVSSSAQVLGVGEILGERWSIVSEGNEVWSEISEGNESWSVVSAGVDSWSPSAAGDVNWNIQ
jgi:hypothetical protein